MSGSLIPMNRRDLLFVDIETSGLDPHAHEIIELAAVRVTHDFALELGSVDRKCRMQHPEKAEAKALEINRYSAEEWKNADSILLALLDLDELIGDGECLIVGHNVHFDWDFTKEAHRREKLAIPRTKYLIDTAVLAFPLCVRGIIDRISLEVVCKAYGIENAGSHRAMTDVRRTMLAYQKLLGMT